MSDRLKSSLIEDYLAQRPGLLRFITARIGNAHTAEDILQEMYLKLSRTSGNSPVRNSSAFLYRVANNLVLDYRKASARRRVRDHNWSENQVSMVGTEPVFDAPDEDSALDARRRLARLKARLDELPTKCRIIFTACKLQGMTHRQAAEYHGISIGTVEKHISKALKYLLKNSVGNTDDS